MKIATYNIASGGFTSYATNENPPSRLGQLQKAISTLDADVLGLTDTFRWQEHFSSDQLQQLFDYPYSYHINMNDTRVDKRIGVALLSRFPITAARAVRLNNRDAIQATLDTTWGNLVVFVLYLDDREEAVRYKQAQALIALLSDDPTIVMGDFNAIWPEQAVGVDQAFKAFTDTQASFRARPDFADLVHVVGESCKAQVLPLLKAAGLQEWPKGALKTAFSPLHPTGLPTIFPVDHILAKNYTLVNYSVARGPLYDKASDHYPLVAAKSRRREMA